MKQLINIFLFIFFCSTLISQAQSKDILAKSAMLNAENSYENGNYRECIDFLKEAEINLGRTDSRLQYMKVKSLIALGTQNGYNKDFLLRADQELKVFFNVTPENSYVPEKYEEMVLQVSKMKKWISEAELQAAQKEIEAKKQKEEEAKINDFVSLWMTKNLNVDHYSNGDPIPEVQNPKKWENLKKGAWCYHNNNPYNEKVWGKLYNWYAVNDSRGLCPTGWHVPTKEEWEKLVNYMGGEYVAGGNLKENGTEHWTSPNLVGTKENSFAALGGGSRGSRGGFDDIGRIGFWWSASDDGYNFAWALPTWHNLIKVLIQGQDKSCGFSIRCLKDN